MAFSEVSSNDVMKYVCVFSAVEHRVSGVDVAGDANATRGSVET